MNIINMSIEVILVADDVLPKPILPHAAGAELSTIEMIVLYLELMHHGRNRFVSKLQYRVKVFRENRPSIEISPTPRFPEDSWII